MRSRPNPLLIGAAVVLAAAPSAAKAPQLDEEFRVNQHTAGIQQSASVALDRGGNVVVVWQSEVTGQGDEIRARRFDGCGAPRGDEIAVNGVSAGPQNAPAVAMAPDSSFVVAWQTIVQNNLEVRARRFDASGQPQGGEIAVNTRSGNANSDPAIASDARGNFVVAWESSIDGSYEIRARRFDAKGAALSGELVINAESASSQRGPALAMMPGGSFVVAWRSNVDESLEIRARRFAPDGAPAGDEFPVNTTRAGDQVAPAVAMAPDGSFVVAWENSFDKRYDIQARRFDANGAGKGEPFVVQPDADGEQFAPAVAMTAAGGFVIAWHRFKAGDLDVRARRFSANGAALSDEMGLNAVTSGQQKSPALATNAAGGLAAAWHSDASGNWDIVARTGQLSEARVKPRRACAKPPLAAPRELATTPGRGR